MYIKKENKSKYLDIYKCQVIKYENRDLSNIQSIEIPIFGYSYSLETYFFVENKFVFYIYDVYKSDNNYMNILQ